MLFLGFLFCFFGLKYHMYFQYCLTFAGAFFSVRLLGMASDAIPGDLVNADNELYIGAAFGLLMCMGIFFYNFWFYRILAACAGFGLGGGATILIGLFAPIAADYVLYTGAAGAVLGIFFMTTYIKTLVGMMYILCGGFMVASASSFSWRKRPCPSRRRCGSQTRSASTSETRQLWPLSCVAWCALDSVIASARERRKTVCMKMKKTLLY